MLIETCLRVLAQHVQDLLSCDGVSVLLGCSEPALRHPLLQRLQANNTAPYAISTSAIMPPLQDERVAALCDMACQTGTMWETSVQLNDHTTGKLIIWPLESPTGVLGQLLLSYKAPRHFGVADCLYLQQCLPAVLQYLEKLLSYDHSTSDNRQYELIAEVSHELRVPLAVIKGYTILLQTYGYKDTTDTSSGTSMSPEQRRHYLMAITEQINYLETLIGDLLDAAQWQTGHLALQPASIEIATLCQSVIQQMSELANKQQPGRYIFRYQAEDELPAVWADPVRVRQVMINLLENAIKYSPNGGQIEITLYTEQRQASAVNSLALRHPSQSTFLYITIRDGGIGIAPEQQIALCKPFVRLEQPLTRSIPGHGLGLYISRKLVEAMHGQLFLAGDERSGTCVTFTLPVASKVATATASKEQQTFC